MPVDPLQRSARLIWNVGTWSEINRLAQATNYYHPLLPITQLFQCMGRHWQSWAAMGSMQLISKYGHYK